ncbi:MAG: hypothetical protein IKU58_06190 [Clostridia bacterium]|nr:hypothetical protein [Clostridia bacterium]
MRVWLEDTEVTGLCTRLTVDKEAAAAGAEAEVVLVCAPEDGRLPRLDPACGQWVHVRQEGELVFAGRVEQVSYDAAKLALTLSCYDPASLLAKNHCRGPYTGTPAEIARQLCLLCGLEPGEIWDGDGMPVQLSASCGRNCYRTLRSLYDDNCVVEYRDGRVNVYPPGGQTTVLTGGQLVGLTSRNTAREAVTRVRVYKNGRVAAQCTDEEGLLRLGLRSRDEYLSMKYPSAAQQARAGLRGEARQARLAFTGRSPVKCGQLVTLDRPLMGVYGTYLVTQVTWRCEKGLLTTELGVESL